MLINLKTQMKWKKLQKKKKFLKLTKKRKGLESLNN